MRIGSCRSALGQAGSPLLLPLDWTGPNSCRQSDYSPQALEQALHEAKETLAAQLTAKVSLNPVVPSTRAPAIDIHSSARRAGGVGAAARRGKGRGGGRARRTPTHTRPAAAGIALHVPAPCEYSVVTCSCRLLFVVHDELRQLGHGSQP